MATTQPPRHSLLFCAALATVAAASLLIPERASAAPANDTVYMTTTLENAAQQLAACTELGQANGDTYYYKSAGTYGGQLLKVKTDDHTKYLMLGTILNGKVTIPNEKEKKLFQQVVDNMSVKQARAIGLSGGSLDSAPAAQSSSIQQSQTPPSVPTTSVADGAVVRKDANTIEASFGGRIVDFQENGGHILETTTAGAPIADLQYQGADRRGAGQKLKGAGRIATNLTLSGIHKSGNDQEVSVNPESYFIKIGTYGVNSDNIGHGKGPGDPNYAIAYAIAAVDLVRTKLDPNFTIPAEKGLRGKAGPLPAGVGK